MASFADNIYGTAVQTAQNEGAGLPQAVNQGAQLALHAEQLQQQAQQLQIQKQQLTNTRVDKFMDDLQQVNKYTDPKARRGYLDMMKSRRDAWGLNNMFSDESINSLSQGDENFGRAVTVARLVNQKDSPFYGRGDLAMAAYNDPVQRANLTPTPQEQWGKDPAASADLTIAMKTYQDNKNAEKRADSQTGAADTRQDRIDMAAHGRVINAMRTDKILGQRITQYQNLDNSLNLITKADHLTPESIMEFQNSVRSNLGIKGTGGVDERASTYMTSLGLSAAKWNEFLTGDPAELAKDSSMMNHLKNLAQVEQKGISNQMDSRLKAVGTGYSHSLYQRRPDLKADFDDAVSAYKTSLAPNSADSVPAMGNTGGGTSPSGGASQGWQAKVQGQIQAVNALSAPEKQKYIQGVAQKYGVQPNDVMSILSGGQ